MESEMSMAWGEVPIFIRADEERLGAMVLSTLEL